MAVLLVLWSILCFLSFGVLGFTFILMKRAALRPSRIRIDKNYKPKVSILVPTYNEATIIHFKLENLSKMKYPKNLTQIVIVDSKSDDGTIGIVNDFVDRHPEIMFKVLVESERKGKSAALNFALKHCDGDVVIVSDADCFWPSDILDEALPFLADPDVGAISGQKILFDPDGSWVTKSESTYLNSVNLMRLGESRIGSTPWFEGGFSAFKKEVIEAFDPYNTGSDDCGTVISVLEKDLKAIFVPEARFYSPFPDAWKEKVGVKIRRTNQLVRVFSKYVSLSFRKQIKGTKRVIAQDVYIYLLSPVMFFAFVATTVLLLLNCHWFALVFLVFLIPKVGSHLFEVIQNYFILLFSIFSVLLGKNFLVWDIPKDRTSITRNVLHEYKLI